MTDQEIKSLIENLSLEIQTVSEESQNEDLVKEAVSTLMKFAKKLFYTQHAILCEAADKNDYKVVKNLMLFSEIVIK